MQSAAGNQEQALVAKVVAGDRRAFARLVEPHIPRLLTTSTRMLGDREEADDAVQNALASVWLARARLDPSRPVLPFLATITLNKCRDKLRRRKAARFLGFGDAPEPELSPDPTPSPEAETVERQLLSRTRKEIERLPLRLREALILVAIDGHTQREAAEILGVSEKAVESMVYRARRTLKEKVPLE